jgi:hypothetical protein
MTRKCRSKRGVAQGVRSAMVLWHQGWGASHNVSVDAEQRLLLLPQPISALSLADIVWRESGHLGAKFVRQRV